MHVELDVFSGRQNPNWSLSPAQASEFRERIGRLPSREAHSQQRLPGLGYRGARIEIEPEDQIPFKSVHIYGGKVVAIGRHKLRLADPNRSLERWVLSTGADQ